MEGFGITHSHFTRSSAAVGAGAAPRQPTVTESPTLTVGAAHNFSPSQPIADSAIRSRESWLAHPWQIPRPFAFLSDTSSDRSEDLGGCFLIWFHCAVSICLMQLLVFISISDRLG